MTQVHFDAETSLTEETFIPDYSGTQADLKHPEGVFQLAQVNILRQAVKELMQSNKLAMHSFCTENSKNVIFEARRHMPLEISIIRSGN